MGNGGRLVQPHFFLRLEDRDHNVIEKYQDVEPQLVNISEAHRQIMMRGLWKVVNEQGGTAYRQRDIEWPITRLFPEEWDVCGKTATATRGTGDNEQDDAWFIAMAPSDEPQIAVCLMVEGGGHGGETASPLVYELLKLHFEKQGEPTSPPITNNNQPR